MIYCGLMNRSSTRMGNKPIIPSIHLVGTWYNSWKLVVFLTMQWHALISVYPLTSRDMSHILAIRSTLFTRTWWSILPLKRCSHDRYKNITLLQENNVIRNTFAKADVWKRNVNNLFQNHQNKMLLWLLLVMLTTHKISGCDDLEYCPEWLLFQILGLQHIIE